MSQILKILIKSFMKLHMKFWWWMCLTSPTWFRYPYLVFLFDLKTACTNRILYDLLTCIWFFLLDSKTKFSGVTKERSQATQILIKSLLAFTGLNAVLLKWSRKNSTKFRFEGLQEKGRNLRAKSFYGNIFLQ